MNINSPPGKIVKNLCTFLCQDVEQTPTFALSKETEKGVLSAKAILKNDAQTTNGKGVKGAPAVLLSDEVTKAKISRRGAELAFTQLSVKFGEKLFEQVPSMWDYMAGGLLVTYVEGMVSQRYPLLYCLTPFRFLDSAREGDKAMEKEQGQNVIDSLSVLKVTASTLHCGLWYRLEELLPKLTLALRSRFAIIRQCTARCFATICGVITVQAMRHVIEHVVPLLGDSHSTTNRQGAIELIYRESYFL